MMMSILILKLSPAQADKTLNYSMTVQGDTPESHLATVI